MPGNTHTHRQSVPHTCHGIKCAFIQLHLCKAKSRHTSRSPFHCSPLCGMFSQLSLVHFGQQQQLKAQRGTQCLPRRAYPGAISHFNDSTELALRPQLLSPPVPCINCLSALAGPLCLLHTHVRQSG